jgi:hypothetical protein
MRQAFQDGQVPHLKVSPIAAIPHKSRQYRMILDLSAKAKARRQHAMNHPREAQTVNEATDEKAAPLRAMAQLGQVMPRYIHTVATAPINNGPLLMAKLDIKDGFWRMCVPAEKEENFCYVLPKLDEKEPTQLVVPAALQMGWTSSPPYFCSATETGRDIAEWLSLFPHLPFHEMENHMIEPMDKSLLSDVIQPTAWATQELKEYRLRILHLFEVFVDDYVALIQADSTTAVRHYTRALLHAIHQIFPRANPGQEAEDPVSQKKLIRDKEGVWATRKEILGWIIDGVVRTIELPPDKIDKMTTAIAAVLRRKHCQKKKLQSLLGKLNHAAFGIPAGRGLLQPLYALLSAPAPTLQIPPTSNAAHALQDFRTLFKVMAKRPTHCRELIPGFPSYIGNCDASHHGVGGTWLTSADPLSPCVWRLPWPDDITAAAQAHKLSINDLEMAGILLHWLMLEEAAGPLKHKHIALWCDNTSAVAWTNRMSSRNSKVGQHLARALALRICDEQASPLTTFNIAGIDNGLADIPSRSFHAKGHGNHDWNDVEFLTNFTAAFPLTQDASWSMLTLSTKLTSLVYSALRGKPLPMASWLRPPRHNAAIGVIGKGTATSVKWTPSSRGSLAQTKSSSSRALPLSYDKAAQDAELKSKLDLYKTRFAPSERPSNWLA